VEIAGVLETSAAFRELILQARESKDEHYMTQKGTQPSQACSGGFVNTQLSCYLLVFWGV
jgi:hypothetical protein